MSNILSANVEKKDDERIRKSGKKRVNGAKTQRLVSKRRKRVLKKSKTISQLVREKLRRKVNRFKRMHAIQLEGAKEVGETVASFIPGVGALLALESVSDGLYKIRNNKDS